MSPAGTSTVARSSPESVATSPRQFGPTSRAPAARTRSTSARSRRRPASPVSPSPAVITTSARAPAASASSAAASSPAGGTASTTRSGGSGRSAVETWTSRPSTCPPRRLTRWTARRPTPRSAERASQFPHFISSSDAPTIATERGSKMASSAIAAQRPGAAAARGARSAASAARRAASVPSRIASSSDRGDRQSPASSTANAEPGELLGGPGVGHAPEGEHQEVGGERPLELGGEHVAEAHGPVLGARELEVRLDLGRPAGTGAPGGRCARTGAASRRPPRRR